MEKTYNDFDVAEMVYPAQRAATLAQDMAHNLIEMQDKVVRSHFPGADEIVNPWFPGTLVSIIGRPQNAKTFMSMYTLTETMKELEVSNASKNEVCILISAEVSVEVAMLQMITRQIGKKDFTISDILRANLTGDNLVQLDDCAYQLMGLPLFIIGHSIQRSKDNRRSRPALSPDRINDAMEYILNHYREPVTNSLIEPRLIVTDYLQRLHKDDRRQSKVDFYTDCVDWAKDIALWSGSAHMLNVQAGRQVDDRQIKIPFMSDGQYTSNVEQSSDTIFTVHMPKVNNVDVMPSFSTWELPEIVVQNNTIYLSLQKQKDGLANKAWVFEGDMARLKLKLHESLRGRR